MKTFKETPSIKTELVINELAEDTLWNPLKKKTKDLLAVWNGASLRNHFLVDEASEYDSDKEMEMVQWYLLKKKKEKESFQYQDDIKKQSAEELKATHYQFISNGNDVIRRYKCPACPRYFSSNYLLRFHHDAEHLHKIFTCSFCKEQFSNYRKRQRHILTKHHLFETAQKCTFSNCPKTFKNPVSLREHILSVHKKNDKKCFQCDQCQNEKFLHQSALNKHMLLKHCPRTPEGFFRCTFSSCSCVSKNYISFRRHLNVHKDKALQYSCDRPECTKKFSCFTDLVKHRHSEHKNSLFTCDACEKKYFTLKKYQSHLLQHETLKKKIISMLFLCPVATCGKTFSSKRNMYEHLIHVHLRLKSYQCTYCSHHFTTFNAAQHHLKKFHTVESHAQSMANIQVIYHVSCINTEQAVQRVATAFCKQTFPSSILRPNGMGLQLTDEVEKQLIEISKDTSYGLIRKKRIHKANVLKDCPNPSGTCIETYTQKNSLLNSIKETTEKIHFDVTGLTNTQANKNFCLHKRKHQSKL
ncbi:oocyte zinc finger protein XlCOF6-like isoform X2 [Hylaeus volcanicus]|uniref:oocyte zinc finger protein XlCOF6-like isoform X2 n=1 Tax=Hylaeus volcanicus TaxID=313075 RepID=UPI0023B87DDF|nr:oocyte zinc finger protein XlCOF6-like isoform X2 [Hylaeus volcanicus]